MSSCIRFSGSASRLGKIEEPPPSACGCGGPSARLKIEELSYGAGAWPPSLTSAVEPPPLLALLVRGPSPNWSRYGDSGAATASAAATSAVGSAPPPARSPVPHPQPRSAGENPRHPS